MSVLSLSFNSFAAEIKLVTQKDSDAVFSKEEYKLFCQLQKAIGIIRNNFKTMNIHSGEGFYLGFDDSQRTDAGINLKWDKDPGKNYGTRLFFITPWGHYDPFKKIEIGADSFEAVTEGLELCTVSKMRKNPIGGTYGPILAVKAIAGESITPAKEIIRGAKPNACKIWQALSTAYENEHGKKES